MARGLRIAIISLYALENNGVRHVAAGLRDAGFPVTEIYFKDWSNNRFPWPTEKELAALVDLLAIRQIGVVGLSVRASAFHRIATAITARIRAELRIPVLWGGMHPTFLPEMAIREADHIALGEMDLAAVPFFERMEESRDLRHLPGFWTREGVVVWKNDLPPLVNDLDSLPLRDFHSGQDKFLLDEGRITPGDPFLHQPEIPMLASRGCPYWTCAYCSNSVTWPLYHGLGQKFRVRGVESLVDEAVHLRGLTQAGRFVRFDDEVFPTEPAWVDRFQALWPRRVGLPFEILVDPRMVQEGPLRKLQKAGLRALCMGVQASERVNREIYRRDVPDARIVDCQAIFHRLGLRHGLQIIWDDPFSTEEDKDTLFRMLMRLRRPFDIYLFGLTLYPRTHLARLWEREGRVAPAHVEGLATHAFHQFRVDLRYPRSREDQRWLALIVLLNKSFVPPSLVWRLYHDPRFKLDPSPLTRLAETANALHFARMGLGMARRGELSPTLIRRWLNLSSMVTA